MTYFQTITATPVANSTGISQKNKNIAIGVAIGIGIPVIIIILIILLFLYRRKQMNSVRNYVDSNGRDVGIAVEDGNPIKKTFRRLFYGFPTINNNPTRGDFDDDMPDDMINEPKPNLNTNFNNDYSSNTGFVVNRPKPLHLVNSGSIAEDHDSDSSLDLASETQSPYSIPKETLDENDDTGEAQHPVLDTEDTEDTDDMDADEYVLADSASPTDSHRGDFPRLDHDTNNTLEWTSLIVSYPNRTDLK